MIVLQKMRQNAMGLIALLLVLAVIVAAFVISNTSGAAGNVESKDFETSLNNASPKPSATPEECSATWPIEESNNKNNRWFYDGIASIKAATTDKEAVAAAYDWQMKVRTDPDLLAGAVKTFLLKDVDRNTLVDTKGCATEEAAALDLELGMTLASSHITADDVPATAHNSGVGTDGTVTGDASGGIGGDLTAIQVKLPDGRTIWIMARCGNLATEGAPPLPTGPTDNPPRCQWNPQLPPDSPNCVEPKVPSQGSGPRGNAPVGQGQNADSGSGVYVAPEAMAHAPAAPYVAPAAPAPVVPAPTPGPSPAPAPTADPLPAPAPEPAAPAPSAPETGCIAIPGVMDC